MSHNDNIPERSARKHRPALWAIGTAIGLALVAFLLFSFMGAEEPQTAPTEMHAPGTDTSTAGDPPVAPAADPGTTSAPPRN